MRDPVLELLAVYGGGIVGAYVVVRMLPWAVIPVVLIVGGLTALAMRRRGWSMREALRWPRRPGADLIRVLVIWCVVVVALGVFTWQALPGLFLRLPRSEPLTWVIVMVLYPLLSAMPQELVFRSLFFDRYERLFGRPGLAVAFNGLIFGAAHVVMDNWVAVAATVPLGWILGWTYVRTRSLVLVWIEHSLYGAAVFTVGLGVFFIPVERAAVVLDSVGR